ncbi:hypothetical protein [Mycobacterium uberis]|uniref:hypothetical protein n=1 Tax=Mycobacterium uberis TaxID=2162698 RepID=UPI00140312E4|nr:hypothetical protein [Mycobacterium uberis]
MVSVVIERTLVSYLHLAGKQPSDIPLASETDDYPFMAVGVLIEGMKSGAL